MKINKGVALSVGLLASVSLGIAQKSDTSQYLTKFPIQDISQEKFLNAFTLSSEECVVSGCCLIPLAGCIMGVSVLKEDTLREKKTKEEWERIKNLPWYRRLSFGIGYSGGVCWTGEDLERENPPPLDPTAKLYWLNLLETMVGYRLSPQYKIGIGTGYMWTYLRDRTSSLSWGGTRVHENTEWEIWGIPLSIGAKIYKDTTLNIEFQINYYFIKGTDIEKGRFDNWSYETIETVIVNCWARGGGCSLKLNYEGSLFGRLKFICSPMVKIGGAREYKNDAPLDSLDDAMWDGPVDFFVTGLYLNLGLSYEF